MLFLPFILFIFLVSEYSLTNITTYFNKYKFFYFYLRLKISIVIFSQIINRWFLNLEGKVSTSKIILRNVIVKNEIYVKIKRAVKLTAHFCIFYSENLFQGNDIYLFDDLRHRFSY